MEWVTQTIDQLTNVHFSVALLVSFIAGVVTSFNPCMIGMASSIFAFQKESKNKSILPITLSFMISFTITFTVIGVISILFGEQVISLTEQYEGIFNQFLALLFFLIGLYVLGFKFHHFSRLFPLKIVSFYAKQEKPKQQKLKHPVIKAYSLGTLFGLAPSPCTTPMIIAMIAYATLTGSLIQSSLLLLMYGIGHGMPFLIIGWMTVILKNTEWMKKWQQLSSKVIGIGLLLVGLYFFFE